jgi:glycosyltransferase involved in cell wall biosynthesis
MKPLSEPIITVVIPTRYRPELLRRAIDSVLSQSIDSFEIVVVVDGPDPASLQMVSAIADERLRVVALDASVGGSEARNTGVRHARGAWIALLDDDDEWMPAKLEKQLAAAQALAGTRILVACRYLDRDGDTQLVRPRRFPVPGQAISDFLYTEATWLGSIEGFPQTSTWFVARSLLLEVPFRTGLRRNQDTDWALQALRLPDVQMALVPETLSIFYNDSKRKRITQALDWKDSYTWAMENRDLFTPRAFATFLAIMCMNHAARAHGEWSIMRSLLSDARRYGSLSVKVVWLFFLYGMIYGRLRSLFSPELRKSLLYSLSRAGR